MSRYISRTFSAHWTIASRSSFEIFPSVRRQRSFVELAELLRRSPSARPARAPRAGARCRGRAPSRAASASTFATIPASSSCEPRLLVEQRVEDAVDVLRDRALLRAGRLRQLLVERRERLADLDRPTVATVLELRGREPAVVADRRVADELADLLRVLGRDLRGDVDEHPADELARLVERRHALLLGPVREAAGPEVVVLVEVPLLALREVARGAA